MSVLGIGIIYMKGSEETVDDGPLSGNLKMTKKSNISLLPSHLNHNAIRIWS